MTDENPRSPVTCACGKTVQRRSLAQHCTSKSHIEYAKKQALVEKDQNDDDAESTDPLDTLFGLPAFLRECNLRDDQNRIEVVAKRQHNTDPYTKIELVIENEKLVLEDFDIDHIHEAQVLASAILHTPELAPRVRNALLLKPLRSALNDVSNLVITEAKVNRSKGQAVKLFLGHVHKSTELPLLAAFIQTADGKERSIARFAQNIVKTIDETTNDMSESIRQTRVESGFVTDAQSYDNVADNFEKIIDRMQLDWNEGVKLRNGKTYYSGK